jgi:hypothetical protein
VKRKARKASLATLEALREDEQLRPPPDSELPTCPCCKTDARDSATHMLIYCRQENIYNLRMHAIAGLRIAANAQPEPFRRILHIIIDELFDTEAPDQDGRKWAGLLPLQTINAWQTRFGLSTKDITHILSLITTQTIPSAKHIWHEYNLVTHETSKMQHHAYQPTVQYRNALDPANATGKVTKKPGPAPAKPEPMYGVHKGTRTTKRTTKKDPFLGQKFIKGVSSEGFLLTKVQPPKPPSADHLASQTTQPPPRVINPITVYTEVTVARKAELAAAQAQRELEIASRNAELEQASLKRIEHAKNLREQYQIKQTRQEMAAARALARKEQTKAKAFKRQDTQGRPKETLRTSTQKDMQPAPAAKKQTQTAHVRLMPQRDLNFVVQANNYKEARKQVSRHFLDQEIPRTTHQTVGDGNCFYYAIQHALLHYRKQTVTIAALRAAVVQYLTHDPVGKRHAAEDKMDHSDILTHRESAYNPKWANTTTRMAIAAIYNLCITEYTNQPSAKAGEFQVTAQRLELFNPDATLTPLKIEILHVNNNHYDLLLPVPPTAIPPPPATLQYNDPIRTFDNKQVTSIGIRNLPVTTPADKLQATKALLTNALLSHENSQMRHITADGNCFYYCIQEILSYDFQTHHAVSTLRTAIANFLTNTEQGKHILMQESTTLAQIQYRTMPTITNEGAPGYAENAEIMAA